jgi:hypothetical protein
MIRALESGRDGRIVWLVLRDLNRVTAHGEGTSDLLLALYERVAAVPWLRIVLDDMPRDVPFSVRPLREVTNSVVPTATDIENYLKRAIASRGHVPNVDTIRAFSTLTAADFVQNRQTDSESSMAWLASRLVQVRELLERML